MRKLKLFFACLLMAVLSIGQVWGALSSPSSCTFSSSASQTTLNDDNTDVTWTASTAPSGIDGNSPYRGLQWAGTVVNNEGGLTLSCSSYSGKTITKIEVVWSRNNNAGATVSATVGGAAFGSADEYTTTPKASNRTATFTGSATGNIQINATSTASGNSFYIKSITVTFSSGSTTPTVSVNPAELDFGTIGVGDAAPAAQEFTITGSNLTSALTVTSSNTSLYTVAVKSGSSLTPSTGSVSATIVVTPQAAINGSAETKSATITVAGGGLAQANQKTVAVSTEVKAKHTVTWNNNGTTSTSQVIDGEKPAFPATPAACDATSTTFIGWATAPWTGKIANLDDKTVYTSASAMPAVTADKTYYAVFAKSNGSSAFDGVLGGTFKIYAQVSDTKYYALGSVTSSKINPTVDAAEAADFEIEAVTGGFTIKSGNKYISYTSSTNLAAVDDPYTWSIVEGSNGSWRVNSGTSGRAWIYRAGTTSKFGGYSTGNVDGTEYFDLEIGGGATYSDYMTNCAACTHLVDAPELDGTIAVTHNTATINWKTLTNASSYDVTVIRNSDSESIFSGNVNALTKALTGLDPETQYDYSIMGVGDGSTYCTTGNGVLNGSFTTDAAPTAHLTLIDINGTHASSGDYVVGTPFNLPTTAATCAKTFVGWDPDDECATAPTYAKGASFTFANTTGVTLHAVYADGGATNETVSTTMNDYVSAHSCTVSSGSDVTMYKTLTLNSDITLSTTGDDNCGSFWGSGTKEWRLYQNKSGNAIVTAANGCALTSVKFTFNYSNTGALFDGSDAMTSGTAVSASGTSATYTVGNSGSATNGQIKITAVEVKYTKPGSYSNYSTSCVDAPVATPSVDNLNNIAAAGTSGTITMTYEHVNTANVAVSLWNNETCTEAFEGTWLTASLNGDKNITYTIAENTSYNDAHSAYIKLTAPETSGAASPAVVVIPVTQVKKAAVFASLEELVASDAPANSNVTVSFSNVVIKEIYMYNSNRRGLVFNIQKDAADIKIYFNADVPAAWVAGGKVSGTLTNCPWKIYSSAWQLAPASGWAWDNGDLTYTAPPAIASIEIRGTATHKTYIDGQAFDPVGLSVIAIYDNSDEEDVTSYATWTYNPEKLSEGDTEVEVTAEYNSKSDVVNIDGLTINPIPNKTIAQFIAAGGTRCYLEGVVSNYTNTTKGYFDMTDASGTIHIYGCTSPSSFAAGDKIKVQAETYEYYSGTTHEAKNVEFVSKISPVQITIADKTLEEGANWTIEVETDPVAAVANISYSIKNDGSNAFVSLAGNVITAEHAGTATIIASIPDGTGYLANSIEFGVEVVLPAVHTDVVLYAEYNGHYYALNNEAGATEINVCGGKVVVADNDTKNAIVWDRAARTDALGDYATFYNTTANAYLTTGSSNSMTVGASADWYWNAAGYYEKVEGRTFIYREAASGFKDYSVGNAGTNDYSELPVIYTGEVVVGTIETIRSNVSDSKYGTICLPNGCTLLNGTLYEVAYYGQTSKKIFFDEILNGHMVAGTPYIILPNEGVTELKGVYTDNLNKTTATPANGLIGSLANTNVLITPNAGNYILYNNQYWFVDSEAYVTPNHAYIRLGDINPSAPALAPGRRRVSMNVNGEQTATSIGNVQGDNVQCTKVLIDGQMYIILGEKMYDATGKLVK